MPNHCEADLHIIGPSEEIKRFVGLLHSDKDYLDVNNVIPYPEEYRKMDEKFNEFREKIINMSDEERREYLKEHDEPASGFGNGGYEWCIENWGTKWGFYETHIVEGGYEGDEFVTYVTTTAWGPATPVILKLIEMFPKLTFCYEYFEGASGFRGFIIGKDGAPVVDISLEYRGCRGG